HLPGRTVPPSANSQSHATRNSAGCDSIMEASGLVLCCSVPSDWRKSGVDFILMNSKVER
ncbi:MAG TPA: hypothetical protein VFC63_22000, partial [Blastocatellia bacterium]|nr:hypothetical protein [Blastocatellia bacterium]